MGKPKLQTELEAGPWPQPEFADYWPTGGRARGCVIVESDEWVKCRGVVASAGWRTEGKGTPDSSTVCEERLHDGELGPGTHRFPFEFDLPEGPISYSGRLVSIIWEVKAWIEIPLRRDPTASKVSYLAPP